MIYSHLEVHGALQPPQHALSEEKVMWAEKVCERVEQQQHLQQYQLSLTLQYQLRARNANATSFLEATEWSSGLATILILQRENKAKPTS